MYTQARPTYSIKEKLDMVYQILSRSVSSHANLILNESFYTTAYKIISEKKIAYEFL